jgi:hypothetical protein
MGSRSRTGGQACEQETPDLIAHHGDGDREPIAAPGQPVRVAQALLDEELDLVTERAAVVAGMEGEQETG